MRANELISIPFNEKVYGIEIFHDDATDLVAVGLKNSIVIYQLTINENDPTSEKLQSQVIQAINHDSIVHSMAWSPSTKLSVAPRFYKLATSGSDHNLRLFSSDLSGQNDTLRVLRGHRDYVNSMAFHPLEEGGQLVSGSDDHTMALWDSETGQRLQVINFDHPIMSIIWHPEEVSKVMIAEKNGVIHLFNIASCKPILSLHCGAEPLLTADWSLSNSLLIAAAVRSDLILFDMSKMAVVSKRKSVQDIVKSVKMAPFSEYILATSAQPNYSVQITNLRSNQTIPILQKEPIAGIAWLRKNQILIVAHNEKITAYQLSNKQA